MNVLLITIPISLLLAAFFVVAFVIAVKKDQFEDLVTPAHRMLLDDTDPATSEELNRKDDRL